MNQTICVPKPLAMIEGIVLPSKNTKDTMPIILGMTISVKLQPYTAPKKIPNTCMPNGVSGAKGGS